VKSEKLKFEPQTGLKSKIINLKSTTEIEALPYSLSRKHDWDTVLDNSINGTFLHRREFLDYHGDRFKDASLILYRKGQPIAIFPAEQEGNTVYSHRGLTYAGWILIGGLSQDAVEEIIAETLAYYQSENFFQIELRMVPDFFAKGSQNHLKTKLPKMGAIPVHLVTHHCTPLPFRVTDRGKRWGRKQALKNGLEIKRSSDLKTFWEALLIPNLLKRHGVRPTHSLAEMESLQRSFPAHIRFFAVDRGGEMLGGALIFVTETTAHLQYIASTALGKSLRCLDLLISWLVEEAFPDKAFFNMGVSHIPATGKINQGLVQWKESFGGQPVKVATYSLTAAKHSRDN